MSDPSACPQVCRRRWPPAVPSWTRPPCRRRPSARCPRRRRPRRPTRPTATPRSPTSTVCLAAGRMSRGATRVAGWTAGPLTGRRRPPPTPSPARRPPAAGRRPAPPLSRRPAALVAQVLALTSSLHDIARLISCPCASVMMLNTARRKHREMSRSY